MAFDKSELFNSCYWWFYNNVMFLRAIYVCQSISRAKWRERNLFSYVLRSFQCDCTGIMRVSLAFGFLKILFRYISDLPQIDPLFVSNWALVIGGIATMVAPFLTSLWMFIIYCAAFGFGVGRLFFNYGILNLSLIL